MTRRSRAREVALQLLFQRDHNPGVPRDAIEAFATERLGDLEVRRFSLELFDGVLAHLAEIDQKLAAAAENWRVGRMATVDRNLLRLATQEFLYDKETPKTVVINEAIEIARRFSTQESPQFINGILDSIKKELEEKEARSQKPEARREE